MAENGHFNEVGPEMSLLRGEMSLHFITIVGPPLCMDGKKTRLSMKKHHKSGGGKILPRNEFDIWWSRNLGYLRFEKKTAQLSLVKLEDGP